MPVIITVLLTCVEIFILNILIAAGIHAVRETKAKKASFTSMLLLLCAPYIVYLVVTKQGHVIDAIAKAENDKIKKYFEAYKEE